MVSPLIDAITRNKGRSELRRWLFDNYDELAPMLLAPRAPWVALAKTAAQANVKPKGAAHYSRQAMRDAWERVKRDKAAGRPVAHPVTQPARLPEAAPVPSAPPKTAQGISDERRDSVARSVDFEPADETDAARLIAPRRRKPAPEG